ncbi:hypothetical protein KSP39_PZI010394 [Platanthera zijinensis]|uniref:Uncharacterized protein n=1 Tax=Platanthera zijinensis TaxID=2320716 RepID=A0AAP0G6L0_9ASPA
MTAMGLRVGQRAAGITAVIIRVSGKELGCINSTTEIATPESGSKGEAMTEECKPARRALEQTLLLSSAEEQVDKAVASALKAAMCARVASVKAVQAGMDGAACN